MLALFAAFVILTGMGSGTVLAADIDLTAPPASISSAELQHYFKQNWYMGNYIKDDYFSQIAETGNTLRLIVPFADSLTICEPGLTVLRFSDDSSRYLQQYNYIFPLLADGKLRAFVSFAYSTDKGLEYRQLYLLKQADINFINEQQRVGLFITDTGELPMGLPPLNLFWVSEDSKQAFNSSYQYHKKAANIDYAKQNSLLDISTIKPLKTIDSTAYSNKDFILESGKKYCLFTSGKYLTYKDASFRAEGWIYETKDRYNQEWILSIHEGYAEIRPSKNLEQKLTIGGVSRFLLEFQPDTLEFYKLSATGSKGGKVWLGANPADGTIYLTSDSTDPHTDWNILKEIWRDISANAPAQDLTADLFQ